MASLLEMVSRARTKLHKHSSSAADSGAAGAQSGTEVSDMEHTDSEQQPTGVKMQSFAGAGAFAMSAAATTASAAADNGGAAAVSFKPASDAELDSMVPSLQPPSVPQPLPLASFSRKMQSNIPLPPLSKDNLSILLKGKHPDSFLTAATASSGKASSGVSTKGSKKSSNNSKAKAKKAAASEKVAVAAPPKAAVPVMSRKEKAPPKKTSITALSANIARNRAVGNARYAYTEGDDSDEYGYEESDFENADPQRFSPEQHHQQEQYSAGGGRNSIVRFALEEEDSGDEDADENERLEQEYSRLREEFNAKLQQAAAVTSSQSRASIDSNHSTRADHSAGEDEYQQDEGEAGDGEGDVEASGHLTQSYAQGHEKISTQDLLRMWELEDAAEEERLRSSQQPQQPAPALTTGSPQPALSANNNSSIAAVNGTHSATVPRQKNRHRYSRSSGYCDESSDEGGADSSEGEHPGSQRSADQRSTSHSRHGSEPGSTVGVPIPDSTVKADDTALDEDCLNFLSKMSSKIQHK